MLWSFDHESREARELFHLQSNAALRQASPIGTGEIFHVALSGAGAVFLHDATGTQCIKYRQHREPDAGPTGQPDSNGHSRAGNRQLCRTAGAD